MRGTASTRDDDIIAVGKRLPRLERVEPREGRKLFVRFDDGTEKIVDLAPALESRRFYKPLRDDDALFRSFRISEYRNAIEWNDELDFSAMWLEALPPAEFSNADFCRAMKELGQTQEGMASALELSRRQVAYYAKDRPIPRHVSFAVRYLLEHNHRPGGEAS
ncbi:DUF2442 domain-containing protein [Martelella alba]|uniref:DUF2442 domain-containing protein n=1 Tax=Martelella alba TaxID=2590451 RepID=A0A506U055_9HYPH|nr:DUF2442 domain-containing protein [Martelella alba]TPW26355.1 DUF2442 domain-containing protein [Martelella alba]